MPKGILRRLGVSMHLIDEKMPLPNDVRRSLERKEDSFRRSHLITYESFADYESAVGTLNKKGYDVETRLPLIEVFRRKVRR